MNEKDRILELVKKGIISTEEGIGLLEKLADKEKKSNVIPLETKEEPQADLKLIPELKEEKTDSQEESSETAKENEENDWETQFQSAFGQAKETLKDAGEQIKPYAKNIGGVLADAFTTVKTTLRENVDWKEINVKVPKVATTSFSHKFEYLDNKATIIDVQNTNGAIVLKRGENDTLAIYADIKMYGSIEGDALENFLSRSDISVSDEKIVLNIPSKRIRADLTLELPERLYDHISLKTLNGSVEIGNIEASDIYVNSTNGKIIVAPEKASMVEVKGVNGDVFVKDAILLDTLINTVNGDVSVTAATNAVAVTLVNGDMRLTLKNDTLTKVALSNVNGTIKTAFPKGSGLDGKASTVFGRIYRKLEDVHTINEQAKSVQLQRNGENVVKFDVRTTTGSIYLKDAEE
ncbi:DUF4097 and DUF4098 domain-containing protein YvlB [Pilibacter termitis]|uniref:DUF4097 and DUF4098 domain-containing protein YvlB n=1 Tax=Pilibacter termitis TaxID=263852 RepID=A0A1T4MBQ1_9ENTE|nr:daptomycin-sensing surface protein LiaX [Pilibacter termitis]SJZ64134.1 DUF4097 and DUF4098 domain-containing protein YvlB [Pilibacter termitis]